MLASFWYCEKDQSFGLVAEGEESSRIAWRVLWAFVRRRVEAQREPQRRGVRRELKEAEARGLKKRREAILKRR